MGARADAVDGPLGLRLAAAGERFGGDAEAPATSAGQIVLADAQAPIAPLFGEPAAPHLPASGTTRLLLFAVSVAGVPRLHVEEALWQCAEVLDAPGSRGRLG